MSKTEQKKKLTKKDLKKALKKGGIPDLSNPKKAESFF